MNLAFQVKKRKQILPHPRSKAIKQEFDFELLCFAITVLVSEPLGILILYIFLTYESSLVSSFHF